MLRMPLNSQLTARVLSKRLNQVGIRRECLKEASKQLIKLKESKHRPTLEEASIRLVNITLMTLLRKWAISEMFLKWRKSLTLSSIRSHLELKKLCSPTKSSMFSRMTLKCLQLMKRLNRVRLTLSKWPQEPSQSQTIVTKREYHASSFTPPSLSWLQWAWLNTWSSMTELRSLVSHGTLMC